jgi:hypothetical protein
MRERRRALSRLIGAWQDAVVCATSANVRSGGHG